MRTRTNKERAIFARLMAKQSRTIHPRVSCARALGLYLRLIAWMFGQIAMGLLALLLIPFAPKRQTICARGFYSDD
jgi:hypothetical protein